MSFINTQKIKSSGRLGLTGKNPQIQPTLANNSFPYRDEFEDFDYSDEEIELIDLIKDKYKSPEDGIDPLHLRDRSASPDLTKVTEVAKGLSPFPDMYKNRDGHLGKSAENISNIHSLGFYVGSEFSGHTYDKEISDVDDDSELPVYSLEDLAKKQLKEYIRKVLLEVL